MSGNISQAGLALGLDIGSISVKLCLLSEDGSIIRRDMEKIKSNAVAAVNTLFARLDEAGNIVSAGVSGSGKGVIPAEFGWGQYSSSLAIASGLLKDHPQAKSIIQIGGQSSLVITLEDGLKKPWKVYSNPLCAAGTGRFLEQQAYRIGVGIEDFGRLALQCEGTPPRIAARCSVFAKSDLIHLQQKGVPMESMLYALCQSIARMVISLQKGRIDPPVYFVGGVAANPAIIRALDEILREQSGDGVVIVPENSLYIEAVGAALLSRSKTSKIFKELKQDSSQRYFTLGPLSKVPGHAAQEKLAVEQKCLGFVGVDIGSTSTKAVIIDTTGKILAKNYLMTAGRPVEAVKKVFANLLRDGADNVSIVGAGITGSGRYLVGSFIGADLIKNEITAQTRAAMEIDPDADIIEIGGQDSKLVLKRNGVVVDYQMNKACAAGTGSFIDELAEMLGITVTNGDFARLAFKAPYTIDLGTRCAAFMGQSVASAQQEGVSLEVITASLANSIAKNYLSKVLGNRKLGSKVILTGAVFYNEAIISAFKQQLEGKELIVAQHCEVSGAYGAALLAKESMQTGLSKFKGFGEVIQEECSLSTFICKACDNNCTITQMKTSGEKPTFYGSRCDRYDSTLTQTVRETFFDHREKLLFGEYREEAGSGVTVGIPRALLVYDFAPLLLGFLNNLGVHVVLSTPTNKKIIEHSVELAYTDSCFPLKLVHGHLADLAGKTDYILYPCAIRLGLKEGDENQKYSCPLVQASPFIGREVLDLGKKLISPILDFSLGNAEVIKNLAEAAADMGFSHRRGRQAALAALAAQREFEKNRAALGAELLQKVRESGKLGVVLLARAYLAQDAGANLGIAEKLSQLGVVPIPLDFLPLNSVNPKDYSDRPYWSYEGKLIAAAVLIARDPGLYGLALTNFGCGPNSFILKLMEDIMGYKPMGQLEIDEHAAEAGLVTRLEAYVDTIQSHAASVKTYTPPEADVKRLAPLLSGNHKCLVIPFMAPFIRVIAAVVQSCGGNVLVLPEPDERSLFYSNQVTAGTECLPYRITLGDLIKFCHENGDKTEDIAILMASSYGPCRLGKYALEQHILLQKAGFKIPLYSTVSNNAYRDMNLGPDFQRLAMKGIFASDCLERLLWRSRPYEKSSGQADNLYEEYLQKLIAYILRKEDFSQLLHQAARDFRSIRDAEIPRKPRIGINGEIYLRSNRFSNNNLVKACESTGLEVVVSSLGEWIKYTSYRHLEDTVRFRKFNKILGSYLKNRIIEGTEVALLHQIEDLGNGHATSTKDLLQRTEQYLSPRCGSEAVLSIGAGVEWLEDEDYAGVISVMPHGCMPGGIVAAIAEKISQKYHKPWISLTYDGILENNNLTRINNFAEIVRFCAQEPTK